MALSTKKAKLEIGTGYKNKTLLIDITIGRIRWLLYILLNDLNLAGYSARELD
jgi:hypothetical protein